MSKKRRYEELLAGEMCVSLINEPIDFEVAPLTDAIGANGRGQT
jgi:hypothetical protein